MEGPGTMQMIADAFRTGGVLMYLILAIALIAHPVGLLGLLGALLAKPRHRKFVIGLGVVGLVSVVVMILLGWLGHTAGMIQMNEALEKASPENAERLREAGTETASLALHVSLLGTVFPTIASFVILLRGVLLRPDGPEAP